MAELVGRAVHPGTKRLPSILAECNLLVRPSFLLTVENQCVTEKHSGTDSRILSRRGAHPRDIPTFARKLDERTRDARTSIS